jgi:hypothetical protein
MNGFYCLSWRLTDAVDAKMSYMAKAPWDAAGRYDSSRAVYREYAARQYGEAVADAIAAIINENEPYAGDFGECQGTPELSGALRLSAGHLFNISRFAVRADGAPAGPVIGAATFSAHHGSLRKAPCSEGGECVGFINNAYWLRYNDVDFGNGATVFEARVASPETGGVIEVCLGDVKGTTIATCPVPVTGDWQKWQTVTVPMARTAGRHNVVLKLWGPSVDDTAKAVEQIAVVDSCIARTENPDARERLAWLRARLAAAKAYIHLDKNFPKAGWDQLPAGFDEWARNFARRVTDISSLGNVQSAQNRFVQLQYAAAERKLWEALPARPPLAVEARGTKDGAVVTWRDAEINVRGYNIFRDGRKVNTELIGRGDCRFADKADGVFRYTVTAVMLGGAQSPPSVPVACAAGAGDKQAPFVTLISPPASLPKGQPLEVKARVVDGRAHECVSAVLCHRSPGGGEWKKIPMSRRVRAVFAARVPPAEVGDGVEYFVLVSDGANTCSFPPSGEAAPLSAVAYETGDREPPSAPGEPTVAGRVLRWSASTGEPFWYRVYRSRDARFEPSPATRLTYVEKKTTSFGDNGLGFDARELNGKWHYRVTAVDRAGNESAPTPAVAVEW